jgi:hypothetical protein
MKKLTQAQFNQIVEALCKYGPDRIPRYETLKKKTATPISVESRSTSALLVEGSSRTDPTK